MAGHDKAVYAYAREDYDWWEQQLGRDLVPGNFGENLTTEGPRPQRGAVGDRWEVGSVLLEVSEPRLPCFKLGLRMDDPKFPKRFAAAVRPGAYLRILREGELGAGDEIRVVERPEHSVTMELMADARVRTAAATTRTPARGPRAAGEVAQTRRWGRRAQPRRDERKRYLDDGETRARVEPVSRPARSRRRAPRPGMSPGPGRRSSP